jgi:hypothetical protein
MQNQKPRQGHDQLQASHKTGSTVMPMQFRTMISNVCTKCTHYCKVTFLHRHCCRYSDWLQAGRPKTRSSSPGRVKTFLFSKSFRPVVGHTQPCNQSMKGALSSGVKRPEREADYSVPTSAEVKKIWVHSPHRYRWSAVRQNA